MLLCHDVLEIFCRNQTIVMTLLNLTLLLLSETGRIDFPWSWLVIVGTVGTVMLALALSPVLDRRGRSFPAAAAPRN